MGVELVQWLCEQCVYVRCRTTAVRVWQVLLELGVLLSGINTTTHTHTVSHMLHTLTLIRFRVGLRFKIYSPLAATSATMYRSLKRQEMNRFTRLISEILPYSIITNTIIKHNQLRDRILILILAYSHMTTHVSVFSGADVKKIIETVFTWLIFVKTAYAYCVIFKGSWKNEEVLLGCSSLVWLIH